MLSFSDCSKVVWFLGQKLDLYWRRTVGNTLFYWRRHWRGCRLGAWFRCLFWRCFAGGVTCLNSCSAMLVEVMLLSGSWICQWDLQVQPLKWKPCRSAVWSWREQRGSFRCCLKYIFILWNVCYVSVPTHDSRWGKLVVVLQGGFGSGPREVTYPNQQDGLFFSCLSDCWAGWQSKRLGSQRPLLEAESRFRSRRCSHVVLTKF